jgi:hypothetical protein
MQIATKIENTGGQYRVEIGTFRFSAIEDQKMAEFGEPTIDVGSVITGSASRPDQINTTATITPVSGGSSATGVVTVDPYGVITGVTITSGGSGYTNGATIAFTGDGEGATASVQVAEGVVTEVVISSPGTGYHSVPYSVTLTLPPAIRRIRRDFPIVQVFDLQDTPDADVQAKVYADNIVTRLTAAIAALKSQTSPFEGEFVTTV